MTKPLEAAWQASHRRTSPKTPARVALIAESVCTGGSPRSEEHRGVSHVDETMATVPWWRRWHEWIGYATSAWSLIYGTLGFAWARGFAGFPFGRNQDPAAELTWFPDATPEVGGLMIGVLGMVGATISLAMARSEKNRIPIPRALLVFAWGVAVVLLLVVPDFRVLVAVAYAPVFLVGAPFGWPPASYLEAVPWPVLHQMICIAGGFLWAATAVVYGRRTGDDLVFRGTSAVKVDLTSPSAASRWGRWATLVAVVAPCLYAVTRWAWALGIPLGISEEFLREGEAEGVWWTGAALGAVAVGGAILTLGLIQRWGEVFPRWVPFLSGRSVPPALAIVPASLIAVIVLEAGLMYVRLALAGHWAGEGENWAAIAPELLWPVWGVALGLATLAYYRRRGRSRRMPMVGDESAGA